jgi:chromosome partitioning protein
MKIIVFAKTKGGVAASTLCYNIAIMAAAKSQVFLVDRDPQKSLEKMWYVRNELLNPRLITDVENVARAAKRISEAGFDRDYMFVDTPGAIMPIITDALVAADLIVVPTQPGQLDLWGQDAVIDRIDRLGLTHKRMFVLTRVQSGKGRAEEAAAARGHLLQHSPHPIPIMQERIDYRRASENGKAAWEIGGNKDLKGEIEKIWEAMQVALKAAAVYTTEKPNVVPIKRR